MRLAYQCAPGPSPRVTDSAMFVGTDLIKHVRGHGVRQGVVLFLDPDDQQTGVVHTIGEPIEHQRRAYAARQQRVGRTHRPLLRAARSASRVGSLTLRGSVSARRATSARAAPALRAPLMKVSNSS